MPNNTSKYMLVRDRVEIYKDFTFNLISYIFKYYLDKETLYLDTDIRNHFMFCYNKVCTEFLEEELDFTKNEELINYFYTYFYHQIYKSENDLPQSHFFKFWKDIFNIEKQRNKNIVKILVELYTIFDFSITKEKNILAIV